MHLLLTSPIILMSRIDTATIGLTKKELEQENLERDLRSFDHVI